MLYQRLDKKLVQKFCIFQHTNLAFYQPTPNPCKTQSQTFKTKNCTHCMEFCQVCGDKSVESVQKYVSFTFYQSLQKFRTEN